MRLIQIILAMTIFSAFIGITNAEMTSSFDMETIGVEVNGIEIDSNDVVVVLDVNVIEDSGSITITFEREFFDSLYYDNDDEFVIIADGNNVHYNEINTNSESRTIQFKLNSDIEAVEIFGTQFMGNDILSKTVVEEREEIIYALTDENNVLVSETEKIAKQISELELENQRLVDENTVLDKRIFELENLIDAMETQILDLNKIVTSQIKTIYDWVLSNK